MRHLYLESTIGMIYFLQYTKMHKFCSPKFHDDKFCSPTRRILPDILFMSSIIEGIVVKNRPNIYITDKSVNLGSGREGGGRGNQIFGTLHAVYEIAQDCVCRHKIEN